MPYTPLSADATPAKRIRHRRWAGHTAANAKFFGSFEVVHRESSHASRLKPLAFRPSPQRQQRAMNTVITSGSALGLVSDEADSMRSGGR